MPPDAPPLIRLTLDLDPRSEPPVGTLTAASGATPFTGWVGLTRAIELALAAERGGPSAAAAAEGPRA